MWFLLRRCWLFAFFFRCHNYSCSFRIQNGGHDATGGQKSRHGVGLSNPSCIGLGSDHSQVSRYAMNMHYLCLCSNLAEDSSACLSSSGMSLRWVEIDLARAWAPGMAYSAASRATTLAGMHLTGFAPQSVHADPLVLVYLRRKKLLDEPPDATPNAVVAGSPPVQQPIMGFRQSSALLYRPVSATSPGAAPLALARSPTSLPAAPLARSPTSRRRRCHCNSALARRPLRRRVR